MTPEAWHTQYGELVRDRDTQARHVASLLQEWNVEKEKLDRLQMLVSVWSAGKLAQPTVSGSE